jgi:hypothetical protein
MEKAEVTSTAQSNWRQAAVEVPTSFAIPVGSEAACKTAPPPPNRFIKTEILHRREADVALESKVLVKRLCI